MNQKILPRVLTLFFVLGFLVSVGVVMAANIPQETVQTITVDTTADELTDNGNCSLREAVQAANTETAVDTCPAGGVTTTIMIPAGTYTLTIPGTTEGQNLTGDLDILTNVKITGAGADVTILNANSLDRFFHIRLGGSAEISDVTITGGFVDDTGGGGIAVDEDTTLNLHDAVVTENVSFALDTSTGGYGGGIAIWEGTFTATNVEISHNNASSTGGGIEAQGGTITIHNSLIQENNAVEGGGGVVNVAAKSDATLTITDSDIISNTTTFSGGGIVNSFTAGWTAMTSVERVNISGNSTVMGSNYLRGLGGGIANVVTVGASSGTGIVNVSHSTIRNNIATNGGGIGSTPATATGFVQMQVTVANSVISGNTAGGAGSQVGNGGGILSLDGSLTVLNSTISGNQATGSGSMLSGLGGGILAAAQALPQTTVLVATTVSENTASLAGDGVANANLGGGSTVQFKNTLIADNGALNCLNSNGVLTSLGYNLDSQNSCGFNQSTDWVDMDPMLGDLTEVNGTAVYPLLEESGAIDKGSCTDHNGDPILADQREMSRPQGATCDIGAYEFARFYSYLPTVTK